MTDFQYRTQLMGFARRLEVVYNQLFADLDLTIRQRWIAEDIGFMRPMLEAGELESKGMRMVIESRLCDPHGELP